ncbi:MAG: glycosyltransferase family 4 protein [Nanoarchaeota archaeon]|nr:glycosyltransferase family 4 protein [Nanoarchaeota archaeon]
MKKIKIAFLAPEFIPTWGGVGIYSYNLIKELAKYDELEIHLITPKRGKDYNKEEILSRFDKKIFIHNLTQAKDTFFYNLKFQLALFFKFHELNKRYGFDIVHSAGLVHMPDIFLKIFNKINCPSVVTVHTTLDSQSKKSGKKSTIKSGLFGAPVEFLTKVSYPYIKLMEKIYICKETNFICVSEYITKSIPETKNNLVINNGINTSDFFKKNIRSSEEFVSIKRSKVPVILYSGRLLYLKGLYTYIEAIKKVLETRKALFVFAGAGDIHKWKNLMKDVSKENYCFLGSVDHNMMPYLYSISDCFVLPSLTESFPLTVLEAMASKLPVIASNVGGIPEIIDNRKTGILVEPENIKMLAASIIEILDDKNYAKSLGEAAQIKAAKFFDAELMAKKTKELYYELIGK